MGDFYSSGIQPPGAHCTYCGYIHPPPVGDACPNKKRNSKKMEQVGKITTIMSNEVIDAILASANPDELIKKLREVMESDEKG